ncbi:hypothetical protein FO440_18310 [Mucilaginibacter corticis]|uniref:Transcription regulator AsnC/Lrp ligand binding domain-containing protein n=1 Tax=Mucilaginibacter corticis TaxID=2597670 RepID=A0A556MIK3_9SPHI|nr:hypothetical protein FO440_18310 [Mucilaginibacter corticis]
MTGSFDFLLRVACRDMDENNLIIDENLSRLAINRLNGFFGTN